ncbi:MAG: hypothetical protein COV34_03400 [Candidatus Zambryskibacteria bacterium CG10_big_fil_rev_8_21_14_0_10_42_12]|uniref:UDP-N-acetylmuramoyl-L-alanyl-D-glutamate--2, 6-diaminopimelate ligase n=1 Tax=Candidatus Zambryskibacteria bacterium CG10_big_fil_rev_8_21_14_0_10_42_12 TaxID=1975115 RepID=A0A2H0QSI6_9BACT|nr:MAG: hypothetical protein COV34_03400 [Candidatus Zambryskibacteria bacterium CG10_big_fil_rev_8_21_14_0_10_42_12]
MEHILNIVRPLIPKRIFKATQPIYHFILAFLSALIYRFPSRKIVVIGVTGTKGKSSTTEYVNAILEKAGYQTAVANTIRHKIGENSRPNKYKMTMPGRFFIQHFLRRALVAGCTHVVIEISSEGVLQYRHRFLDLDALIFTNLSPEHLDTHGSYENYVQAKVEIGKRVIKKDGTLVVNGDDEQAYRFLALNVPHKITFSTKDIPHDIRDGKNCFRFDRKNCFRFDSINICTPIKGMFTAYNMIAAATYAEHIGIKKEIVREALEEVHEIKGRAQEIDGGQDFVVVVDYAHTPDSLEHIYKAYDGYKIVGVLGGTGGGRDTWKRKEMGKLADRYCEKIYLTNEDPYDEDPWQIINHVADGIEHTDKLKKIMDRREAIREALMSAKELRKTHDLVAVLITGKGTDPYIMEAHNKKTPWSDEQVVREELKKL